MVDPSKRAVGVVCSNEDLKAIVHQHKRRASPAVSPTADGTTAAPSFVTPLGVEPVTDRAPNVVTASPDDPRAVTQAAITIFQDTGSAAALTWMTLTLFASAAATRFLTIQSPFATLI